jgi:hypothetical protein
MGQTKTCDQPSEIDTLTHQSIYTKVDQMPEPEGGMHSLYKKMGEVKYPAKMREESLTSTIIGFIVNEKGEVFGERIIKAWDIDMAKKFLYVIKKHKWKPGSCKGTKVPVLNVIIINPPKLG